MTYSIRELRSEERKYNCGKKLDEEEMIGVIREDYDGINLEG